MLESAEYSQGTLQDRYDAREVLHGLFGSAQTAEASSRLEVFLEEARDEIKQQAEEQLAQWAVGEASR